MLSTIQTFSNLTFDCLKSEMDENSFELCSSYFQNLRIKTCKIDNGINELSEIWKTPHLLIGGYGERPAKIDTYFEEMWKFTSSTNDAIEKFRMELKPSLEETDQLLNEAQTLYEDLKVKCGDIDTVLAEYNYYYEEHEDSILKNDHKNDNKSYTDKSILNSKELEVEFTPNLTWKCKAKFKESDQSISN